MFGLRALLGDALHRRGGCGGSSDASAALYSDCYESPRMSQPCRGGGCEPEGFCYSATPRFSPYYAGRGMLGRFGGLGGFGGFGGGIGGALLGLGLGRMFGGGGRGMFLGGLLGGLLGRFIGRFAFRGGGGGGYNDGGGCDNGGYDQGFDNEGFDNGNRYDQRDRDRREERDRERETENRNRQIDSDRSGKLDGVRGVSDADKQRAQSMTTFERNALSLINDFRRSHGLSAVAFDPRLQLIAQVHSQYQDQNGLGHTENRSGWQTPGQRMRQVGLNGWAENSGYGSFDSAEQLVQMWIHSAGHRRALLDPNVTIAGISQIGKGATLDLV